MSMFAVIGCCDCLNSIYKTLAKTALEVVSDYIAGNLVLTTGLKT